MTVTTVASGPSCSANRKAAMTLPLEEALLPGVLTVPLIGLTAFGAARVVSLWNKPEE